MFWRLFAGLGGLAVVSLALLGMLVISRVEDQFLQQKEDGLKSEAILVREAVGRRLVPQDLQEYVRTLGAKSGLRITLIGPEGSVLADSQEHPQNMENHGQRPEVLQAQETGVGRATRYSSTVHQSMMYVAIRTEANSQGVGFVRVALPLGQVEDQLNQLRRLVWTAVGLIAAVAMALAFWLARRIIRPLQELTQGARQIAEGSFGYKVFTGSPDEVGVLAQSFNQMSEQLAAQFSQVEDDRRQLRAILSGMIEGVVALDSEERILFANDRAGQMLEFQQAPVLGRHFWEVVRQRSLQEMARRALTDPEPFREELTWSSSKGGSNPGPKSLTVHAAGLTGSPARGAVLVFHDTSELRRLERLRQEFVANVSHELKTPLSVIKATVETLLDGGADDPKNRLSFLNQIAHQADRLHALILDLLSLARIESATEVFQFQAVSVADVVQACVQRHQSLAHAKNQTLEIRLAEEEIQVWGDEEALGQILDNLVANAVQYTPAGGRICVRWQAENDHVCLEVQDTGIGIPEADLPRIFERFYRVDKARSRELGGTGLGLSIVKHLVQAMHGTIQATSKVGEGSTFTVRLPRLMRSSQP
jgi:two-component system phosphate regulon sensor histidine kinase PhoR